MKFTFSDVNGNPIVAVDKPIRQMQPTDTAHLKVNFDKEYDFDVPLNYIDRWGNPSFPLFIPMYAQLNARTGGSFYKLQTPSIVWQIDGTVYKATFNKSLKYPGNIQGPAYTAILSDDTQLQIDASSTYNITINAVSPYVFYYWANNKWNTLTSLTIYPGSTGAVSLYYKQGENYSLSCVVVFVGYEEDVPNEATWMGNLYDFTDGAEPEWDNNTINGNLDSINDNPEIPVATYADGFQTEIPGYGTSIMLRNEEFYSGGGMFSGGASICIGTSLPDVLLYGQYSGAADQKQGWMAPYKNYGSPVANQGYEDYNYPTSMNSISPSTMILSDDRITPQMYFTNWTSFNDGLGAMNVTESGGGLSSWTYLGGGRIKDDNGKIYNCIKLDFIDPSWRTKKQAGQSWGYNLAANLNDYMGYHNILIVADVPYQYPNPTYYQNQYMVFLDPTINAWDVLAALTNNNGIPKIEFLKQPDLSDWDVSKIQRMDNFFNNTPFDNDISKWDVSNMQSTAQQVLGNCPIRNEYKPKAWQS